MRRLFGNAIQQFYGQLTITAPTAGGTALAINNVTGQFALTTLTANTADISFKLDTPATGQAAIQFNTNSVVTGYLSTIGSAGQIITGSLVGDMVLRTQAGGFRFSTNAGTSSALAIAAAGNVSIAAPTSGVTLAVNPQATNGVTSILASNLNIAYGTTFVVGTTEVFSSANALNIGTSTAFPLGLFTGAGLRLSISSAGAVSINTPTSGTALSVSVNGLLASVLNLSTTVARGSGQNNVLFYDPTGIKAQLGYAGGDDTFYLSNELAAQMIFRTSGATRLSIAAAGNVSIAAPTSGTTLAVTGIAGTNGIVLTSAGTSTLQVVSSVASADASIHFDISATDAFYIGSNHSGSTNGIGALTNTNYIYTNQSVPIVIGVASVARLTVFAGVQIGSPTGGDKGAGTINATGLFINGVAAGAGASVLTINSQSAAYTAVLADGNNAIYHPTTDATARTFTIPANASVAYAIGTTLTFVNDSGAGLITIAITTDVLVFSGTGSVGSRLLAANGSATALKVTATRWQINGANIT